MSIRSVVIIWLTRKNQIRIYLSLKGPSAYSLAGHSSCDARKRTSVSVESVEAQKLETALGGENQRTLALPGSRRHFAQVPKCGSQIQPHSLPGSFSQERKEMAASFIFRSREEAFVFTPELWRVQLLLKLALARHRLDIDEGEGKPTRVLFTTKCLTHISSLIQKTTRVYSG